MAFPDYLLVAGGAAAFVVSGFGTALMLKLRIVDTPNARSSHARPTPRTGGLAIAPAFLIVWGAVYWRAQEFAPIDTLAPAALAWFATISVAVLIVFLADDIVGLKPLTKLGAQAVAAAAFVATVASFAAFDLPGAVTLSLGPWGAVVSLLWIVFFMNVFNFMDGINGIAAGTALIACLWLAAAGLAQGENFVGLSALILAGATAGFFVFNFPSGRIFMGDHGSQFLGFAIAGLAVWVAEIPGAGIADYLLPMVFAPFIFDVLLTLILRAARGENVLTAHREHLYQIATKLGCSHVQVSLVYFALAALSGGAGWVMSRSDPASAMALFLALVVLFCALAWGVYRAGRRADIPECVAIGRRAKPQ